MSTPELCDLSDTEFAEPVCETDLQLDDVFRIIDKANEIAKKKPHLLPACCQLVVKDCYFARKKECSVKF